MNELEVPVIADDDADIVQPAEEIAVRGTDRADAPVSEVTERFLRAITAAKGANTPPTTRQFLADVGVSFGISVGSHHCASLVSPALSENTLRRSGELRPGTLIVPTSG